MPTTVELLVYDEAIGENRAVTSYDLVGSPGVALPPVAYAVGIVPVEVAPENLERLQTLFVNTGDFNVWLGVDDTVTPSNGIPLEPDDDLPDYYTTGSWYAVTDGPTGEIRRITIVRP